MSSNARNRHPGGKPRVISAQIASHVMRQHYAIWGKRSQEGPASRIPYSANGREGWWEGPYRGVRIKPISGLCGREGKDKARRVRIAGQRHSSEWLFAYLRRRGTPNAFGIGAPTDLQRHRLRLRRWDDGGVIITSPALRMVRHTPRHPAQNGKESLGRFGSGIYGGSACPFLTLSKTERAGGRGRTSGVRIKPISGPCGREGKEKTRRGRTSGAGKASSHFSSVL